MIALIAITSFRKLQMFQEISCCMFPLQFLFQQDTVGKPYPYMHVCICNVQVVELHFACEWLGVFFCVDICVPTDILLI